MTGNALEHLGRPEWQRLPLWSVAPRSKEAGAPTGRPLSVFIDAGVVPRDSREDNHNQLGEDLSRYLVVRPGDIVFNKLRSWQGGIGASRFHGIVSPAYYVCRPKLGFEPRFLHYLFRSDPYLAEITRISKWMPPSQFDTPWEVLRVVPVLSPPVDEQRRIAGFLDAEILWMDQIIALRKHQAELISSRRWSLFEKLVTKCKSPELAIRRILQTINDGPFGSSFSSSDYVEDGAAVVRLGNIGFDEYRPSDQARISMDMYYSFLRHQVRPGDVLIAALGDSVNHAGRACVAPSLGPAIVKGKSLCARVDARVAEARYLSMVLSSNIGKQSISTRGSTRSMINIEIIKSAVIPVPSLREQREIVRIVNESRTREVNLLAMVERQVNVLVERRQALITAAVTGQLDVTTARSGVR